MVTKSMAKNQKKTDAAPKKKKRSGTLSNILLSIIFLVGLGLLAYPSASDYYNSFHQTRAILSYNESIASMNRDEYDQIINNAKEYNKELARTGMRWKMTDEERAVYDSELNVSESGNMGYITIPKLSVELPIYHGTSESVLQRAIGHLEATSLPVGGQGTHCVLSGHRGLPSAKLFSDLDKMVIGDTFTMSILNETLTYEVDQIRIVEPTDVSDLRLDRSEDYCTLLTCTPYGINTHRLLVRGRRIGNMQGEAKVIADAVQIEPMYITPFIGIPLVILLVIAVFVETGRRRRRS